MFIFSNPVRQAGHQQIMKLLSQHQPSKGRGGELWHAGPAAVSVKLVKSMLKWKFAKAPSKKQMKTDNFSEALLFKFWPLDARIPYFEPEHRMPRQMLNILTNENG